MKFTTRIVFIFAYFLGITIISKVILKSFNNLNPFIFTGIIFSMGIITLRWDWGILPYLLRKSIGLKELE